MRQLRRSIRLCAALAAVMAAIGCGGGGGAPAVDAIVSVDPANGATGIPVTRAISVIFNQDIDETTLIPANITLKRANDAINVPGAITYDAAARTMTFTPDFPMVAGTLYTFTVTTSVLTKATATNYITTFTTQPAPLLYLTNHNAADPATPLTSYNLWSMAADGSAQTQLTAYTSGTSVSQTTPLWSPDYTRIAYGVAAGWGSTEPVNLYAMNADGTSPTALTAGTGNFAAIMPVWLRNGTSLLANISADTTASPEIYDIASVPTTGAGPTNLTSSTTANNVMAEMPPDLSPSGTSFLYSAGTVSGSPQINVNVMNVDGTGAATLTSVPANTAAMGYFSPDGATIYYSVMSPTEAGGIYSMNADGTGVQTLVTVPAGNIARLLGVSPDGARIAYLQSNLAASLTDLYILTVSTAAAVKVTTAVGSNSAEPGAWSPDGRRFAYVFGDDTAGPLDLYVVNADGSTPQNLTRYSAGQFVESPIDSVFPGHWSPDGTQIFFTNSIGLIYNIGRANADNSGVTAITASTTTDSILGDVW